MLLPLDVCPTEWRISARLEREEGTVFRLEIRNGTRDARVCPHKDVGISGLQAAFEGCGLDRRHGSLLFVARRGDALRVSTVEIIEASETSEPPEIKAGPRWQADTTLDSAPSGKDGRLKALATALTDLWGRLDSASPRLNPSKYDRIVQVAKTEADACRILLLSADGAPSRSLWVRYRLDGRRIWMRAGDVQTVAFKGYENLPRLEGTLRLDRSP